MSTSGRCPLQKVSVSGGSTVVGIITAVVDNRGQVPFPARAGGGGGVELVLVDKAIMANNQLYVVKFLAKL